MGPLAQGLSPLSQLGLGLSGAREDQMGLALEFGDRVDQDVEALLGVEAGGAADDELLGVDSELLANPVAPGRVETESVEPQRVGEDGDLRGVHAGVDDRLAGPLGDRPDRADLP